MSIKFEKGLFLTLTAATVLFAAGCASPRVKPSTEVDPDTDPLGGAITSGDVRTVASKMCPAILAVPEVAECPPPVRILIADFKNNSRFLIDKDLFANRLRTELNTFGGGRVRFLSKSVTVQNERGKVLTLRQQDVVRKNLKELGAEIAKLPWVAASPNPIKIAVIPVINTNLVNLNADSFAAMLRSEIVNAAGGKVQFLMPGAIQGADYYLTGQFVPESMRVEGIINLMTYVQVIEDRVKRGQSLDLTDGRVPATSNTSSPLIGTEINIQRESELVRMMRDPALRADPNVNKRFNVMLVKPDTKVAVFEKMFLLDRQITDNSDKTNFILSGEINALSQRRRGAASDYLLITVNLVDPETNDMVWEGSYETKRITDEGIVYQ